MAVSSPSDLARLRPGLQQFIQSALGTTLQRSARQLASEATLRAEDALLGQTAGSFRRAAPSLLRFLRTQSPQHRLLKSGSLLATTLCSRLLRTSRPPFPSPSHLLTRTAATRTFLPSLARTPLRTPFPTPAATGRTFATAIPRAPRLPPTHFQHGIHNWELLAQEGEAALRTVNQLWATAYHRIPVAPWNSLCSLWSGAVGRLPSANFFGHLQVSIISAINLVGQQLPRLMGLFCAELLRTSRWSSADAFDPHYLQLPPGLARPPPLPWWRAFLLELQDAFIHLTRLAYLLMLFAPVVVSSPLAIYFDFKRKEWLELLRKTLEAAGPAFIKWGQWAATRHDLFPPDLCSELELLHSQAPAHRFKHTKATLEQAFGLPLTELFEEVEVEPLASGSIGQVHRAVLSEKGAAVTGYQPGTTVAIKVRHPGVGHAIIRDFATMLWVAHCAAAVPALQHLRLEETLQQFAAPLREQVDFLREAHNLWRFNHNFRKTRHVQFPVPLYPLVSPDVLVESYEAGRSISRYIASLDDPINPRLAELGSGTMLQMMLVDNLIHSDLHPGNILVRLEAPRGLLGAAYCALERVQRLDWLRPLLPPQLRLADIQRRWLEPKIVLLDVGMATELTGEDRNNMVGLFRAFASLDGRACADWVLRFSGEEQTCPDPEAFKAGVEAQFQALRRPEEELNENGAFENGAEALGAVLEVIRQHQVNLPGHICAVVVTTLVLEGWSNKLDPHHSVLTQVQSMLKPEAVPWRERISSTVDSLMASSEEHLQLL